MSNIVSMKCFCLLLILTFAGQAQFEIGGDPRVDPDDYIITTFAEGLNFPVGMDVLPDGSVVVIVTNGGFFGNGTGSLIQLIDADNDGVAETQNVLVDDIPGGQCTAVKVVDHWVFVTGQGRPMTIYRLSGETEFTLEEEARITIQYQGGWLHPNSAIAARRTPNQANSYDLFIHLGSKVNFEKTTDKLLVFSNIGLLDSLAGDAIHMATLVEENGELVGDSTIQVATGLRSAAGFAFHPETGDLYLEDNGIDGLQDPNEPHSADELNVIPFADIGGEIDDFGFPDNYTSYRNNEFVGGGGIPPLVSFQPQPDPFTGDESEGPNDIAFAPPAFPEGMNNGIFVGFHGKFFGGGVANEENPLVYVDLTTYEYFHFIGVNEEEVGHLDGLLTTDSSLYISDISPSGGLGSNERNTGKIYRIHRKPGTSTSIDPAENTPVAGQFWLSDAYPNPFNPETQIRYQLPKAQRTELTVYDVNGRIIATLVDEQQAAGTYTVKWNGADAYGNPAASGIYFYRLTTENFQQVKRMLLIK